MKTKVIEVSENMYDDFVGEKIFVRTVTQYLVGKVTKTVGNMVFLSDASWIADTGRFSDAIKTGTFNEQEPVGDWFFNMDCVVDGGIWKHDLPTEQK